MPAPKLEVEGLKELDQTLAKIPSALRRNTVLGALRKTARPFVRDARRNAPRGRDPRRRGSAKVRRQGRAAAIGPAADSVKARAIPARKKGETRIAIGPSRQHWYLMYNEFGTSRQAARPWFRPAWDAHKARLAEEFGSELWKNIERTARRLARQAETGKLSKKARRALGG